MENRIEDENYYTIHGWQKNRLQLKGIKRDIFAIIYGFSQDGECEFTGSIKYFEEWLDVSRPTIIKALQDLTESGFISKRIEIINGVQFNRYKVNLGVVKKFNGGLKNLTGGKEILPNKENNNDTIINNNIKERNIIKERNDIIEYLNSICGTRYKSTAQATQRFIKARLNEGYTIENFKTVIDKKAAEWKGTEMAQYLRPETLFGTKFESYLNAPIAKKKQEPNHFENEREFSKSELDSLLVDVNNFHF